MLMCACMYVRVCIYICVYMYIRTYVLKVLVIVDLSRVFTWTHIIELYPV